MGYKIAIYVKNNKLLVFDSIKIKDVVIPDIIESGSSMSWKEGSKYIVLVDSSFTRIEDVVEELDKGLWILDIIQELNIKNSVQSHDKTRPDIIMPSDYFIEKTKWEFIVNTIMLGKYILLTGPTGCGKTQLAQSLANYLGYDFYYLNCGMLHKPKQTLVGSVQAKDGSTFLVDSEFITYFKSEKPTLILLDELSRIPGQGANAMMTILDRKQAYIYVEELGQRIYKGKNVIFIATANFGIQYVDTRKLDNALMNRFIPFHLSYLPTQEEIKMINAVVSNLDQKQLERLIKAINILRDNFETLGQEVSHRHSIDMAEYLTVSFSVHEIIDNVLINLFVNGSDDRRDQVKQILNAKVI